MNATTLALWGTVALVALALVPTIYVLAREAVRRAWTRRIVAEVARASEAARSSDGDAERVAAKLTARFSKLTVERALIELLRADEPRLRAYGAELFARVGLVERYAQRLREASRWSERAHAAEVLGRARATSAVPALVAALRDRYEDDVSVKVAAAGALAQLRDESAIPLLVKELRDVDERSSRTVSEALAAFGPLAVPELLACLADSGNAAARVWAARILGTIGDARATDDLVQRLYDRDDKLRMAAAEALGAIGDARALQSLVRATLRDPAPQVRAHAAGAVSKIEGARALDVLVAALADPDYGTRLRALEAFETMRLEDTSALEAALRDPNVEVRRRAALALERVGYLEKVIQELTSADRAAAARAYDTLLELGRVGLADSIGSYVHHPSFEVRALAARACGELGIGRLAPIVITALDDPEWPVRAAACAALSPLRHERAPAALVARLVDNVDVVREAAAEALANYPAAEIEPHFEAVLAAYDAGSIVVRTNMVALAARVATPAADDLLVRASADPSELVRIRAVPALADRGGRALVEPLVARLTDASLEVRMAAVSALGSATSREAFEGLLHALGGAAPDARDRIAEALSRGARGLLFERLPELERSASLDVRIGVSWTLGKTSDPRAVPTLGRFLRDGAAPLRASAAGALAKIAAPDAMEALLGAADDPDGRVRAAVVNALGRATPATERVLSALERRGRDPDPFVRNRAVVALARAGGARAEPLVRELARNAAPFARTVALSLLGTDEAIGAALDDVGKPGALGDIARFLAKEDPAVRAAFHAALYLEDKDELHGADADLVVEYAQVLRASLDVDARRLAVAALSRLRGPRATEVLGDAVLADPDETVRLRAARALAPLAFEPKARGALLRAIDDPNPEVVALAIEAVAGRREREVGRALVRRLGAVPEVLVAPLESALAEFHRGEPMDFVDWMMGNDVPELLVPAVRVLARIADPVTVPLLRELARSRSAPLRAGAVAALGKIPGGEARDAVFELLHDPSEDVRVAVLDAVPWTGDGVLRTAPLRRDPSVRVRAAAAAGLEAGLVDGSEKAALRALEAMLDDASSRVRAAALGSLAAAGRREGLLAFARLWPTTPLEVRSELREEPRRAVASERLAATLASAVDSAERQAAVVAIGAFGAPGFHAHVLGALRDPAPGVRTAAVLALAQVDDPGVRERLRELLSDPDPSVREAARRTLVRTVG